MAAASGSGGAEVPWQEQCTAEEVRFVKQVRSVNIIRAWVHTCSLVAYNQKYLRVCGGDTVRCPIS